MELEGIMLNEISQRKTNTVLTHKYNLKKKKKKQSQKTSLNSLRKRFVVKKDMEWGWGINRRDQKVQNSVVR